MHSAASFRRSSMGVLAMTAAACVLSGCATRTAPASTSAAKPSAPPAAAVPAAVAPKPAEAAAARPPAPAPLVGHVTRAALEDYETWKTLRAQDYTPDDSSVKTVAERGRDVDVLAIVATWCPDSKREVPRLFKIYDLAGIGFEKLTMVAVDRTKKDPEGLTEKYQVLRVPTFVFFRGGKEIGRVTERATTTLEGDIAGIISQ